MYKIIVETYLPIASMLLDGCTRIPNYYIDYVINDGVLALDRLTMCSCKFRVSMQTHPTYYHTMRNYECQCFVCTNVIRFLLLFVLVKVKNFKE